MIQIKRTYDPASPDDGRRFLVDRLWPRGIARHALAIASAGSAGARSTPGGSAESIEAWLVDVAPSTALRTWFGHRVERWDEFRRRYTQELAANPGAWRPLLDAIERGDDVTLLYSARDTAHNQAVVLRDYLEQRVRRPRRRAR